MQKVTMIELCEISYSREYLKWIFDRYGVLLPGETGLKLQEEAAGFEEFMEEYNISLGM